MAPASNHAARPGFGVDTARRSAPQLERVRRQAAGGGGGAGKPPTAARRRAPPAGRCASSKCRPTIIIPAGSPSTSPAGTDDRRVPGDVERRGVDDHLQRPGDPDLERVVGGGDRRRDHRHGRHEQHVDVGQRLVVRRAHLDGQVAGHGVVPAVCSRRWRPPPGQRHQVHRLGDHWSALLAPLPPVVGDQLGVVEPLPVVAVAVAVDHLRPPPRRWRSRSTRAVACRCHGRSTSATSMPSSAQPVDRRAHGVVDAGLGQLRACRTPAPTTPTRSPATSSPSAAAYSLRAPGRPAGAGRGRPGRRARRAPRRRRRRCG